MKIRSVFCFSLTRPFSLWEQITLHELIIQHDLPVPEFKKFLKASNPTVVMFALQNDKGVQTERR